MEVYRLRIYVSTYAAIKQKSKSSAYAGLYESGLFNLGTTLTSWPCSHTFWIFFVPTFSSIFIDNVFYYSLSNIHRYISNTISGRDTGRGSNHGNHVHIVTSLWKNIRFFGTFGSTECDVAASLCPPIFEHVVSASVLNNYNITSWWNCIIIIFSKWNAKNYYFCNITIETSFLSGKDIWHLDQEDRRWIKITYNWPQPTMNHLYIKYFCVPACGLPCLPF